MPPILAENIDGGLFAAAAFLGALLTAVLALAALIPASRRDRRGTLLLAAPALLAVLLVTGGVAYGFVTDGLHDPDSSPSDFVAPWLIFAGPPLAAAALALAVLWVRTRSPQT